ncbi:MAG: hypothetical protein ABJC74_02795 [Gemmatimonadota bacterium]
MSPWLCSGMANPASRFSIALRHPRPAGLAFLAVLVIGLWAIGAAPAGSFYDDGIYLTLGRSLARGHGFRYLNLPGTPAATHYPPGYPALLAVCWWLGGQLPQVLLYAKILNALLMGLASGALAWLLAESDIPPLLAAAGVVAGAAAVPVLALSTIPFSEPLFLVLLIGGSIMTARALRPDAGFGSYALAGLAWGAVFLVRTVGGVMIPVGALLLMRHSGRRAAGIALAVAVGLSAPWIVWSGLHAADVPPILSGSYGSYAGWYLQSLSIEGPRLLARIVSHNLSALLRPIGVLLTPPGPPWLGWIVIPAGLALLGFGAVALARASVLLAGTIGLYLLVVLVWPYPPDRFVWGIWPIVTAVLASGFAQAWRSGGSSTIWRRGLAGLMMLAGAGAGGYLLRQGDGVVHRSWEGPQLASAGSMEPTVRWVKTHAAPGVVIATVDDPMLYLYSGHPSVPVLAWSASEHVREQSVDTAEANLERILAQYAPEYVILPGGGTPEAFAVERMWRERKRLELIDTLPGGGAVFRPRPPGLEH